MIEEAVTLDVYLAAYKECEDDYQVTEDDDLLTYGLLRRILTRLTATPDRSDDALAWLATKPRLAVEHFGPVYGDDDDQSAGWRVMRETGPINDREWDEVARGDTPLAAITAARAALKGDGL